MFQLILAAALTATNVADAPAAAPAAPSSTASDPAAQPATRYCVVQQVTGSMIPLRTCHTRQEWLVQGFDPLDRTHRL